MGWWNRNYPKRQARREADGIKAKTGRGQKFGQTWWGGKWLRALEQIVDKNRLQRGRSYARSGQVLDLEFDANSIASRVQGSRAAPYKIRVEVAALSNNDWERVASTMASKAIFAAKLLAGEMPQNIEEAFSSAGVSLFPEREKDLATSCSCPDWANPCKHVSAVYYLLSEQFDEDPFLLFQLRGRGKAAIIAELRVRRGQLSELANGTSDSQHAEPAARRSSGWSGSQGKPDVLASHPDAPIEEEFVSLAQLLDRFWETADDSASPESRIDLRADPRIAAPPIDAAPVKRLGEPPFWKGSPGLISQMTEAYHSVSEAARKLTLGE